MTEGPLTNPEVAREAKKRERQELAQNEDDIRKVMSRAEGRRLMGRILRMACMDRTSFSPNALEMAMLEGKRTFLKAFGLGKNEKGLNLKKLFDDPPQKLVFDGKFPKNLPDRYFSEERDVDIGVLFRVFTLFENTTSVAYAAWFN